MATTPPVATTASVPATPLAISTQGMANEEAAAGHQGSTGRDILVSRGRRDEQSGIKCENDCCCERAAAQSSSVIRPPGGIPAEDSEASCQSGLPKMTILPPPARETENIKVQLKRSGLPGRDRQERLGSTMLSRSAPLLTFYADRLGTGSIRLLRRLAAQPATSVRRRYLLHGLIVGLASVGAAAAMAS